MKPGRAGAISKFHKLLFRFGHRLPVDDFEVRATLPEREEAILVSDRLKAALGLIRRCSPLRYTYLRRDLPRILVGATHNLGECHSAVGIVVLQFDFLVAPATTPELVALVLIHEGMHARLTRAGVAYEGALRARSERLCAKAELLVASRLPNGAEAAEAALMRLAWPDTMWEDAAFRERGVAALKGLGWEGRIGYRLGAIVARWGRRQGRLSKREDR